MELHAKLFYLLFYGHLSCVMWHWIDCRVGAVEGLLLSCVQHISTFATGACKPHTISKCH